MPKERDLKREWELEKARKRGVEARIVVKVPSKVNEDFINRCKQQGISRNALLRRYIEMYTYEGLDM